MQPIANACGRLLLGVPDLAASDLLQEGLVSGHSLMRVELASVVRKPTTPGMDAPGRRAGHDGYQGDWGTKPPSGKAEETRPGRRPESLDAPGAGGGRAHERGTT